MKDKAPERIWADPAVTFDDCDVWHNKPAPKRTEYIRADLTPQDAPEVREALRKVEAALADIAEGEPDPDDIAEAIWCRKRAAEGLRIARDAITRDRRSNRRRRANPRRT